MKTALMLILMASPAHAVVSDGMWFSPDKQIQIAFDGMAYTRFDPATGLFIRCTIDSWPISTPVAETSCENGETHSVRIEADAVVFDGIELRQTLEALD